VLPVTGNRDRDSCPSLVSFYYHKNHTVIQIGFPRLVFLYFIVRHLNQSILACSVQPPSTTIIQTYGRQNTEVPVPDMVVQSNARKILYGAEYFRTVQPYPVGYGYSEDP
jgi:hypothetical protein